MPKKKPKPPAERHAVNLRFNDKEYAPLAADLSKMPGVPVSFGAYCKHAVEMYPKLRKLEARLRDLSAAHPNEAWSTAEEILEGAGL